jgi:hypothetical protein
VGPFLFHEKEIKDIQNLQNLMCNRNW